MLKENSYVCVCVLYRNSYVCVYIIHELVCVVACHELRSVCVHLRRHRCLLKENSYVCVCVSYTNSYVWLHVTNSEVCVHLRRCTHTDVRRCTHTYEFVTCTPLATVELSIVNLPRTHKCHELISVMSRTHKCVYTSHLRRHRWRPWS